MEKFWGENVRSTPTSITSGWFESTRVTWSYVEVWLFVYFCQHIIWSSLW